MVNVPTAVWIDEQGRILRHDEDAYSKMYKAGDMSFGNDIYRPAVYDWVRNGEQSVHVQHADQAVSRIPRRSDDEALAEASFKLGVWFHLQGNAEQADHYWDRAQELHPDSWNYHRQDWSFLDPQETGQRWFAKYQSLEGRPYYRPLEVSQEP
jgi:hypothetical protein